MKKEERKEKRGKKKERGKKKKYITGSSSNIQQL